MIHYICTGTCGGVSEKPGACQAEDCPLRGEQLDPCSCEDGHHGDGLGEDPEEEEEE